MENAQKYVLSVEDAGKRLGLSRPSAYQAVKRGELPVIRIGRRILVPVVALEKMLENTTPANSKW
jgi:excisionase family DNA binding protein